MQRIIVIFGPTASSKSRIAIETAKKFNGEVLNADSRQFFKYMQIGTASPSDTEKSEIPHHLYNILLPSENINAGLYIKMADSVIREISERNRIPVIVGGTGLYLKSLIKGMADIPEIPIDVRKKIKDMIETDGIQRCYEHLKKKDPEYAARISPSDRQRIERALEVITFTNEKFSSFHSQHRFGKLRYNVISIGIMPDRKLLYERINKRTRDIFSKGIIQETEFLIDNGYGNSPAFNAIGYYESCRYIKREITLDEAIETTALRTRQYAKRQITWFRRTEGQIFTDPDNINIIFRHIDLCLK